MKFNHWYRIELSNNTFVDPLASQERFTQTHVWFLRRLFYKFLDKIYNPMTCLKCSFWAPFSQQRFSIKAIICMRILWTRFYYNTSRLIKKLTITVSIKGRISITSAVFAKNARFARKSLANDLCEIWTYHGVRRICLSSSSRFALCALRSCISYVETHKRVRLRFVSLMC